MTGWSEGYKWSVFSTIKYGNNPITGIDDNIKNPCVNLIIKNYPNPFNSSTTICYTLPEKCHITLSVFNNLGQKIQTLVNEIQTPGAYEINWDAGNLPVNNVYFYRIEAGKNVETGKMVLIR